MKNLTDKQQQIIEHIKLTVLQTGDSPTIGELATQFGVSRSTMNEHLRTLMLKGVLERSPGHRSLRVIDMEVKS